MEFLGQRSDWSRSCHLSCSCRHAGSFTYCAGPEIEPTSQNSQLVVNPITPQQELQEIGYWHLLSSLFTTQFWLKMWASFARWEFFGEGENLSFFFFLFFSFLFFSLRVALVAYGSSQARGWIGAVAAGLHISNSNAGSLAHWASPGIEPASSWILVRLVTTEPKWGTLEHFNFWIKILFGD